MRRSLHHFYLTASACLVVAGSVPTVHASPFDPLFRVTSVKGDVTILRPGHRQPELAREDHAYPYGSRIIVPQRPPRARTPEPEINFSLSRDHRFRLSGVADLIVADDPDAGGAKKVFHLHSGSLKTFISISTVKTGGTEDALVEAGLEALTVRTPIVTCTRLTDRNEISVIRKGDAHAVTVATESGTMELSGEQFNIHGMRRNAVVEIFGRRDYTSILSRASDFTVELAKGVDDVETVLFRPRSVAKIWRSYAEIGGKMAVSVMLAYPDGSISSYAFLEGESVIVDPTYAAAIRPDDVDDPAGLDQNGAVLFDAAFPAATDEATGVTGGAAEPVPGGFGLDSFNFDEW